jgi:hypothetical protein
MQTAAENGGPAVDEMECLRNALGARRGFTRGVGRQVKRPSSLGFCCTGGSSADRIAQLEEELHELREEVNELKRQRRENEEGGGNGGDAL